MIVEEEKKWTPIIGRVYMDQCMIDVTDILNAAVNSKVTMYGKDGEISVDHIAVANGTITMKS